MTESNRIEYKRELTNSLECEQDDFFVGYSMLRNKTLMRVFKDLELVEYLGSGMPRILKAYSREAYIFSSRFIRARFLVDPEALALEREVAGLTTGKNYRKGLQEREKRTRMEPLSRFSIYVDPTPSSPFLKLRNPLG